MKIGAYGASLLGSCIPARHFVSITSGPDDVGISRIRDSKTGFAAAHVAIPARFLEVDGHTRPAHVPVILHVAIEVVRNLVVDIHVIHLADGQSDVVKASSMNGGDNHSTVVGD